ncbi:sialate O-acetylesterase [Ginsengibacter hankyongi]|uniref:Sialate O-acetylesterase n=1 Tax=Ginsengibacter hankyongi TaxID=2607284 RepID=A0A5J5IL21_9BACT|nr:sialate O-acetylesterase [Ginsengibacter hankyongi]KAA9040554.1 sialate O-acetylesterase [Ginsengibacter hankyongi]
MKLAFKNLLFIFLLISNHVHAQQSFLLAGQSNAVGHGDSRKSNLNVCINAYEYDVLLDSIKLLKDPAGQKWKSLETTNKGGTMLPSFAKALNGLTQEKVVVLMAARGGSSCSKNAELDNYGTWDTSGKLFTDAVEKTNKAINKSGILLTGIIWMQGERDANAINDGKETGEAFKASLESLIKRFKNRYGKRLPFFIVQTGYQSGRPKAGNDIVREIQAAVAKKMKRVYVAYEDTNLFFERNWMKDNVHYNQDGLNDIGEKVAKYVYKCLAK